MKKRWNFWDYLAWIVLALILLWLILKMLGIINTPVILEYSPYLGGIYLAGWAMHKLDRETKDVVELKIFAKETIKEISNIKINCAFNHPKE